MRPMIIGAGRGKRLECITDKQPKSYSPIGDKKILEWIFEEFSGAGFEKPVFIGGYLIDMVRRDFPFLTFCHNTDWERNNILASLMYYEFLSGIIAKLFIALKQSFDIFQRCVCLDVMSGAGNESAAGPKSCETFPHFIFNIFRCPEWQITLD